MNRLFNNLYVKLKSNIEKNKFVRFIAGLIKKVINI